MTEKTGNKVTRRPYRKMRMEGVQLVAEEAVLGACKIAGATGSGNKAGCINDQGNACNNLVS